MDRDTIVYNNMWKENCKYMDASKEVMELAKMYKSMKVLDLCAGGGRNSVPLLENGHMVTAVDRNKIAILELSKLKKIYQKFTVLERDAVEFLYEDSQIYDFIIVFDCIHHFAKTIDQLIEYLDIISSKLEKGGKLLISFLANITYPGGNESVNRLYLDHSTVKDIFDQRFRVDFHNIVNREEEVYFGNAQNVIDNKIVTGEYRALRIVRLYERNI